MTQFHRRQAHALLLAIVIVGAGLRVWGIGFGLPHTLCRPDEEILVQFSLRFFSGDLNPHFFEWPSLAFYLVYGLVRVIYYIGRLTGAYSDLNAFLVSVTADSTWIFQMCRGIAVACGVLTLFVVYRLAQRLFDVTTALVATSLLAVAFLHVRDSHFGILDVPLALLVVTSISILANAWQREGPAIHLFALAGVCAGFATSFKYNGSALLVAALMTAILKAIDAAPGRKVAPIVGLAAFCAAFVTCFFLGTPYALLDVPAFREGLAAHALRMRQGHGIRINQAWLQHLTFSLRYGLGLPLLVMAIGGMTWLWVSNWRKAAMLCTFPLAYFAVVGSGHTAFVRYTTPLVPFLCITAAFGLAEIARRVPSTAPSALRSAALPLMIALAAWPSLVSSVRFDRLLTQRDTRLLAADWLAANMGPNDRLYESGWIYAQPHFAWAQGRVTYVPMTWDRSREVWVTPAAQVAQPDWIVVAESPLRLYTPVTPELRLELSSGYQLVQKFSGSPVPERESWFDRQDAFFVPFAHLGDRERPGPDLSIYRRKP